MRAGPSNSSQDSEDETVQSQDSGNEFTIYKITDNSKVGGSVQAELKFWINDDWKTVKCDLDTGANVCIMGYKYLNVLFDKEMIVLDKSQIKLASFGGTNIEVKGQIGISCHHKNRKYRLIFQIVNVDHGPHTLS